MRTAIMSQRRALYGATLHCQLPRALLRRAAACSRWGRQAAIGQQQAAPSLLRSWPAASERGRRAGALACPWLKAASSSPSPAVAGRGPILKALMRLRCWRAATRCPTMATSARMCGSPSLAPSECSVRARHQSSQAVLLGPPYNVMPACLVGLVGTNSFVHIHVHCGLTANRCLCCSRCPCSPCLQAPAAG